MLLLLRVLCCWCWCGKGFWVCYGLVCVRVVGIVVGMLGEWERGVLYWG
jgi:hypothetical protein